MVQISFFPGVVIGVDNRLFPLLLVGNWQDRMIEITCYPGIFIISEFTPTQKRKALALNRISNSSSLKNQENLTQISGSARWRFSAP